MAMWIFLILLFYIIVKIFDYGLEILNYRYLNRNSGKIPPELEGHLDLTTLEKTTRYSSEKIRFGLFSSLFDDAVVLVFIFSPLLFIYISWIGSLKLHFIVSGTLCMLIIVFASNFIGIPFNLYSNFKIEKKYGFNKMTLGLWVKDFFKSILISGILSGIIFSAFFALVQFFPNWWWLFAWFFFFVFSLFIMFISPYVIEPLFNKFESVEDEGLVLELNSLMSKAGLRIDRVFKMDASKRTGHSNAYFTGIGKVKRIVLFDTLLSEMERKEIAAILAHEAGHWKRRHIIKGLIVFEILSFAVAFCLYLLMGSSFLNNAFSFPTDILPQQIFLTKMILAGFIMSIVLYPFFPIMNMMSRKFEREADSFACQLTGNPYSLISSLLKLHRENLSNPHPHPLYSTINYSHPPLLERIATLKRIAENNESQE